MQVAIGREIKAARARRGLTQPELADLAGIGRRQMGKIERGEAGQLAQIVQIASALDVEVSVLMSNAEKLARAT